MKLTKKAVETKSEKVLEISESEFFGVVREVGEACIEEDTNVTNDATLIMLAMLNHAQFAARLQSRLFNEEDK